MSAIKLQSLKNLENDFKSKSRTPHLKCKTSIIGTGSSRIYGDIDLQEGVHGQVFESTSRSQGLGRR